MPIPSEVQYVSDASGNLTGVLVAIVQWREIPSELETAYLLRSEPMRRRLLEPKERTGGVSFDDALDRLGLRR